MRNFDTSTMNQTKRINIRKIIFKKLRRKQTKTALSFFNNHSTIVPIIEFLSSIAKKDFRKNYGNPCY